MVLYNGRPENTDGRLLREVRTYDFLDGLGVEYQRTDHEPANNMEACNVIDAVLGVIICKNLFLCNRQKTRFYLLMMPGNKKFKTKELSSQINSARLSFADPEDMLKYLDIEPGAGGRIYRLPSVRMYIQLKNENGRCDKNVFTGDRTRVYDGPPDRGSVMNIGSPHG